MMVQALDDGFTSLYLDLLVLTSYQGYQQKAFIA